MKLLQQEKENQDEVTTAAETTTTTRTSALFPPHLDAKLSEIRPYHVAEACKYILEQQTEATTRTADSNDNKNSSSNGSLKQLHVRVLEQIEHTQAPVDTLKGIVSVLTLLATSEDEHRQWKRAMNELGLQMAKYQDDESYTSFHKDIYERLKTIDTPVNHQETTQDLSWARQHWMYQYEQTTGCALSDKDAKSQYQRLSKALNQVEINLQQYNPETASPQKQTYLLADMYTYVGIRQEQAQRLGYAHHAERILSHNRMVTSLADIQALHQQVAGTVVPFLQQQSSPKLSALDDVLNSTGVHQLQQKLNTRHQKVPDQMRMLRLEHYVTLDGAMQFVAHLARDLWGIQLVASSSADPDNSNNNSSSSSSSINNNSIQNYGWHDDVRLFHCYNDDANNREYLGSFYLDPFARPGKLHRPMTCNLLTRSKRHAPVTVLSLCLEPPAWNTEPAYMTWDDVEALLHEIGHVVQSILARPTLGTLLGPQHMPFDFSEFWPKYLEHWLTERSTLLALIDMSNATMGSSSSSSSSHAPDFSDEALDAALRVRARAKAFRLAQLVFYGTLELELFSTFDVKGDEKMLDLTHRLASELIPHDLPSRKDMTPLIDILQENANGREVAWYRYLLDDVQSAIVFDQYKSTYKDNAASIPELRKTFRKLLLEPGASIDKERIRREFQLDRCSAEALFQRYSIRPDTTSDKG